MSGNALPCIFKALCATGGFKTLFILRTFVRKGFQRKNVQYVCMHACMNVYMYSFRK